MGTAYVTLGSGGLDPLSGFGWFLLDKIKLKIK